MSIPKIQRTALFRAVSALFDRENPWRLDFFVLRLAQRIDPVQSLAERLDKRFRSRFQERPTAIFPYLRHFAQVNSREEALSLGQELVDQPTVSASEVVEVAKYYYSCGRFALGDALLERAKESDPKLPRIYDEEAWNQRARGNLHREIQALRHSIELTQDPQAQLRWEMRLGEAYLRLGDPVTAWGMLRNFDQLPPTTPSIFSAAYCAVLVDNQSAAEQAYKMTTTSQGSFDYLAAARKQLYTFGRATEALRLLRAASLLSNTEGLEIAYRAYLRSGLIPEARNALETAASRSDRSAWVRGALAQFYHIDGQLSAALDTYATIDDEERTPLLNSLHGGLLAASGDFESAVHSIIGTPESAPRELSFALAPEVDPRVPELFREASKSTDQAVRHQALVELLPRLSNPAAIAETSLALGHTLAIQGHWEDAWGAVRAIHGQRLPALSLGVSDGSLIKLTWEMQYFEWAETEPILSDTVLYESSLGESTSCNPLAICLELLRDPTRTHLTHVWSITPRATIAPELLEYPNVRFVRKGSIGHIRYLASVEYLINNATWEHCFTRRAGQHALNTWHGVPWKTMGRDLRSDSFAYGNVARSLLQAELVIVPDPHTLDVLTRGMDIDDLIDPAALMLGGYPRNDLALNVTETKRAQIRKLVGVPPEEKLVLFMPTWKGLFGQRNAEVSETLEAARELSGAGYVIAVRAHQYVREAFTESEPPPGVRFIPDELDTNELLGVADALVTDFSSVLFDAAAVRLPVVLLTVAIDEYRAERGLYFTPEEVPGQSAPTYADAARLISEALTHPADYIASYKNQTRRFCAEENGTSAAYAIQALFDGKRSPQPIRSRPRSLLLTTGGLPPNGITRAARSLLWALDGSGFRPHVPLNANSLATATPETIADVRSFAKIVPWVGGPAGTRMEREILQYYSSYDFIRTSFTMPYLESGRRREARRLFGNSEFAAAVEYGAYDSQSIALVALGVRIGEGHRGVILHSEMWKEITTRYPRLRSGMSILGEFDFIASVSDGARSSNTESLFTQFGVPKDKHITLNNMINTAEILHGSNSELEAEDLAWYGQTGVHACIVGRLSPEKNHQAFLRALARVTPTLSRPFFLTLLGNGPLMIELQQTIAMLGLQDRVRLRGLVPNPYVHIQACDALLLPSLHEGQPLVILESLAIGTPVVATDIPGSRSVLHEGRLGRLVPLSDDGLEEAIRIIDSGDFVEANAFDPRAFTEDSRKQFLSALTGLSTAKTQA